MKRYLRVIVVFLALLCALFICAQDRELEAQEIEPGQESVKTKNDIIKEIVKNSDATIEFYGVVKDQYGNPVPDAKVEASYEHFNPLSPFFSESSTVSVYTDPQGAFVFKDLKGSLLSIDTIEKVGYVYDFRKNEHRYFGYESTGTNQFMPDEQNPIVFTFNKKPEPGFVIEKTFRYRARNTGTKLQIDVYNGFSAPETTIKKIWGDMRVEVSPVIDTETFIVKVELNNQEDWLLVKEPGDNHVAPDDGYAKSVELSIKQQEELLKDFYYKGQKEAGIVYSRLHLELRAGASRVRIKSELYTNLDGGKNLNYDWKYTLNRKIQDVSVKIEADPENSLLYKERAELKRSLGLYEGALSDVAKAQELAPEDKSLLRLKERIQTNKERHAELEAEGFEF